MIEIYDPLYKTNIILDGIIERIVLSPQFQRLKDVKQLGFAYHAYPKATHSRYEHSIGVYYLATKWLDILAERISISLSDRLCVQIAALCHDLGHGPFSHECDLTLFPNLPANVWKCHEAQSIRVLEFMLQENQIQLSKYGLHPTRDLLTIEEMILGTPPRLERERNKMGEHTLWPKRRFLYDIVNNVHSGLDIDKIDYLRRDTMTLGFHDTTLKKCPIEMIFKHSYVLTANETSEVFYTVPSHAYVLAFDASKCFDYITSLFRARMELHRMVYRNPASKAFAMNVHENIKHINMNMCFQDLDSFTNFTDSSIMSSIQNFKEIYTVDRHKKHKKSDLTETVYIHCGAYDRKPTDLVHWINETRTQRSTMYLCEMQYNQYYKKK